MKNSRSLMTLSLVFAGGFLCGILFSAWKMEKLEGPAQPAVMAKKQQDSREQLMKQLAELEQVVTREPGNLAALVQLGNGYFDTGNFEKAIDSYEKALKIEPRDPDVITDLGVAFRRTKRPQESVNAFRRALEVDPKHPQALFNLGLVLRDDLKDPGGALKAWEMFLERAADSPHAVMIRPWVKQLRDQLGVSQEAGSTTKQQ